LPTATAEASGNPRKLGKAMDFFGVLENLDKKWILANLEQNNQKPSLPLSNV